MKITAEFEKMELEILSIFQKMTWEEQFCTVGRLRAVADRSYENRTTVEAVNPSVSIVGKVIQFPVGKTVHRGYMV